ncbi:MAG: cupin domain-containing protein [Tepidisphaerales bacterium]
MTDGHGQPIGPTDALGRLGLIGGIGLTEVSVYTQRPAGDGMYSGCPHVHAVTDEAYYVLRGSGWAEFHDVRHGYRRVDLRVGDYVHFPPGVVHRLVSAPPTDGPAGEGLVVLGIMGNAGMAEQGEARVYFGPDVDADPAEYARRMDLPRRRGLDGALERRDLAVEAYRRLLALREQDERAYRAELDRFCRVHRSAMAARADVLRAQVLHGPMAWAHATLQRIAGLLDRPSGDIADRDPGAVAANRAGSEAALGMCGTLRTMLRLERLQ